MSSHNKIADDLERSKLLVRNKEEKIAEAAVISEQMAR